MTDPVVRLNAALQGRYAIERELGEGGMATVYLADDLKHERKVALKVLKPRSELKVSVCGLKRLRSSRIHGVRNGGKPLAGQSRQTVPGYCQVEADDRS